MVKHQMKESIDIVIIDDHPIALNGMKLILATEEKINIKGGYLSSHDFFLNLPEKKPNLIIADTVSSYPEDDNCGLLRQLHKRYPASPVLALSEFSARQDYQQAIRCGAKGYISKSASKEEIFSAIFKNARLSFNESVQEAQGIQNNNLLTNLKKINSQNIMFPPTISHAELNVLHMIIAGHSLKTISNYFQRSIKTISSQKRSAYKKLGVKNDCELMIHLSQLIE